MADTRLVAAVAQTSTVLLDTPERIAAFIGSEIDNARVVRAAHVTLN